MSKFIQHIARYIVDNYDDYSKLNIILPSQRAKKYLQDALYAIHQKPFFSPQFYTLDAWVKSTSSRKIVSKTALLFELYHVYVQNTASSESFESFSNWGEMLLNDFDEIDRYLVDAKQIFCNLRDIKEIENWSFNATEMTKNQQQFLEFWEKLEPYYTAFNQHLAAKKINYMGAAMKELNEKIIFNFGENDEHYLFAGFNALSPAEINIIKQLVDKGCAKIFAEADDFFYKDEMHEAGEFLRKLKKAIPQLEVVSENTMLEATKNITLINCAEHTSQSKTAYAILQDMEPEEVEKTLLLLADETLIVPTIKNLPSKISEANITLGMPLKYTHLKAWVNLIFSIQEHLVYFNTKAAYHKDLTALFNNTLFQKMMSPEEYKLVLEWQKDLIKHNRIFSSVEKDRQFSEATQNFIVQLFKPWQDNWIEAIKTILLLNTRLFSKLDFEKDMVERSALYHFDKALRVLLELMENNAPEMTLSSFKNIFNRHWTNQSVAYYGNPTSGLQVMGLLETRMLSFENIIVLGLNEGSMPPTNPIQTIIPMDLRKFHGMPTPNNKEALFAHHFYRLLPEANNIWVTYFSGQAAFGSESSRYIKQIELEWTKMNPNITLEQLNFQLQIDPGTFAKGIEQNEATQLAMKRYFERGVSQSSLGKFIDCPLDFYYRYLLELYETDEVEEEVEHSLFGNFVHKALEQLYEPFVNKQVLITDVEEMLRSYPIQLEAAFLKHFNQDKKSFQSGKNFLSYQMASYHLERYLKMEKQMLVENPDKQLYILALEKELKWKTKIDFKGEQIPLYVNGFIDRIDEWGGETRIIDYKTGKCEPKKLNFKFNDEQTFDFEEVKKKMKDVRYAFQLGLYAMLYKNNFSKPADTCAILSFTNLDYGYQALELNSESNENISSIMENLIRGIALEMLSVENFAHDKDAKYCKYCND